MTSPVLLAQPRIRPIVKADGTALSHVSTARLSRDGSRVLIQASAREFDAAAETTHRMPALLATADSSVIWTAGTRTTPESFQGRAALSPDGNIVLFHDVTGGSFKVLATDVRNGATRTISEFFTAVLSLVGDLTEGGDVVALVTSGMVDVQRADGSGLTVPVAACFGEDVFARSPDGDVRLAANGGVVIFRTTRLAQSTGPAWVAANTVSGTADCVPASGSEMTLSTSGGLFPDASGDILAGTLEAVFRGSVVGTSAVLVERTSGRLVRLPQPGPYVRASGLSDDGTIVLLDSLTTDGRSLYVHDVRRGLTYQVAEDVLSVPAALSGDGSTVFFQSERADLAATPVTASGAVSYIASLDVDGDGMHDAWETTFGLNPSDAADASLDPDNDGRTNAQEYADGTHPNGVPVRYFAEGADGPFFATSLALFNPSTTATTVNVRFLGPGGTTASRPVALAAQAPAYLDAGSLGLPFSEFSIVVESAVPVVAERRMTWDRTEGYGVHTGNGVAAPATQWQFAEGATIAGIQTFLLLQNPGTTPAAVTTRYLLANGTTQERQHVVPASSRLTVWVNQEGAPLDAAEFATTVIADGPIVAERATYRDAASKIFGAGSVAAGVATPSTTWLFAEGSTGSDFDTFLLLANPGTTPATVTVDYLRAGFGDVLTGFPLSRSYVVAPGQRATVWVDQEDPALADVAVSTRVTSDVPIVAERAMWWPGPTAATWHGTHVGTGNPTPGLMWAIADAEVGPPTDTDTFVTVAHLSRGLAELRVTAHLADGRHITREFAASNRHTLWPRFDFPESVGQRFALTIESLEVFLGPGPSAMRGRVPLTVETVLYRKGFEAGDVSLATRLPDPVD